MKVMIVAPPWEPVPPVNYGGTEVVLDSLCRGLAAAGHDVLLFTTGDSRCPVAREWVYAESRGVELMNPATEIRHVLAAYDTAARWGADVVHDHTLVGPLFAGRFPDLAVVTTSHGPFDDQLMPLYREVAAGVDVIAISHHQASTADGIPVTAVIHHGIDPQRFPFGAGAGGYALFLGRMEPDKGVHVAAQVARAAGVPLRIAAKMREPVERQYYEHAVRPLLGGGVEYVGEVGGEAKLALLADATCLLNPIDWPEPFGMVMIEALACGTPVVVTPRGAAPEIVDDGVTGFVRADEGELAAAIDRVGGLSRRACRTSIETRFSVERMAAEHAEVYERVVDRRRHRRRPALATASGKA